MNDRHELTGELKDAVGDPIIGAKITVTPVPPFTLPDGTNVSSPSSTITAGDGSWSLRLYPSPISAPNSVYLFTATENDKVILTKKFRMPPADSSLYMQHPDQDSAVVITPIAPVTPQPDIMTDTTLDGDGSASMPLKVASPFSNAAHTKLDGIEPLATADQTWAEIVSRAQASSTKLPASTISGLPTQATPTTLGGLTDVTAPNPVDGQVITWDSSSSMYTPQDLPSADIPRIIEGIEAQRGADKLDKGTLRGETTVLGGQTLPLIQSVPAFTLRALQGTSSDNPTLHIAAAQYAVPSANRNEADLTLVNGNFRIADSVDGGTGSASNNFENFIGFVSSGTVNVTVAVYWRVISQSLQDNPATHLYITTPASGIGATTFNLLGGGERYVTLDGKRYTQYRTASSAFATALKNISGEQNWEFHTNAAGTADLNFQPATHLTSGSFHDLAFTNTDATLTGDGREGTPLSVANPFTSTEKSKLAGIANGAEANVKSDYNATSGDAEILNKPTIPTDLSGLSDVSVVSPQQGESLLYIRAGSGFRNRRIDNPTYADIDVVLNNVSAASGDHLLYSYTWSDLQGVLINFALGHSVGYRLIITTDQPFHSVKFRRTGATGAFIGSTALPGRVGSDQTVTGTGLQASLLSPEFDIYLNRSTSATATITRVRLFLYLYIP